MPSKPIKFVDLARMHDPLRKEIREAVVRVAESDDYIFGHDMIEFEKDFAKYCGSPHCISVNSGMDALRLAVEAMGIGKGDEVIVPANTFIGTAYAVSQNGGTPVFADIDPDSYNLSPAHVEQLITKKTKAIIPVHLYGQCADMKPLMEIARKHDLLVLEDAAQGHGAEYQGKRAPIGDVACYSFYPGKNLGAIGDGGAVVTKDDTIAAKLLNLRNYGSPKKYHHPEIGYNSRLDNIQAAVLRVKLPHLSQWVESRRAAAKKYDEGLQGVPISLPREMPYGKHAYHVYCIRTPQREKLREHLDAAGIQTNIHYPKIIYSQEAYAQSRSTSHCPVAEKYESQILSLPMFPGMTDEEITRVCTEIKGFFK